MYAVLHSPTKTPRTDGADAGFDRSQTFAHYLENQPSFVLFPHERSIFFFCSFYRSFKLFDRRRRPNATHFPEKVRLGLGHQFIKSVNHTRMCGVKIITSRVMVTTIIHGITYSPSCAVQPRECLWFA